MKLAPNIKRLLELKSVLNFDEIQAAKQAGANIHIIWDNGTIFTDMQARMQQGIYSFNTIALRVDFKTKTILYFPMDDRSDFRFIKKLQQALADLIKAKIINADYKITITDKESTKQEVGSLKIDDILKYDSNFVKSIPICFHGTSNEYLPIIKKYGLVPLNLLKKLGKDINQSHDNFYTEESADNVYLTIDYALAKSYARQVCTKAGGDPIIIIIKDLSMDNIDADDDIINNVGSASLLSMLSGGSKYKTYIDSIRINAQFSHKGRIPANKIFKIKKI